VLVFQKSLSASFVLSERGDHAYETPAAARELQPRNTMEPLLNEAGANRWPQVPETLPELRHEFISAIIAKAFMHSLTPGIPAGTLKLPFGSVDKYQ
jgi:hypothetical protein